MDVTRDRLIDAATRLLDQGGPVAVTLREVGRLAGVSHNAPYKHFVDKEDLLAAVAARELARQSRRRPPSRGQGHSAEAALRDILHRYIRWALRYPARFKLIFSAWSTSSAELAAAASNARTALATAVQRAQTAGAVTPGDPERIAALILATAHGAVDLALTGHLARDGKGHANPHDLIDDLIDRLHPHPSPCELADHRLEVVTSGRALAADVASAAAVVPAKSVPRRSR